MNKFKGTNASLIYEEFDRHPDVKIISEVRDNWYFCEIQGKIVFVNGKQTTLNNPSARSISIRKENSKFVFTALGIPTAAFLTITFSTEPSKVQLSDMLNSFLSKHGRIVVKPTNGTLSLDVTTDVVSVEAALEALESIRRNKRYTGVLFEEQIEGDLYRFTYIAGKLVAVAKRDFAHVIGDGVSTITELTNKLNDYYLKHRKQYTKRGIDLNLPETIEILKKQNVGVDSIPPEGLRVVFTKIPDPGFITNVFEGVNQRTVEALSRYCRSLGLEYAGFDVMTTDLQSERFTVIEVNSRPDIDLHHYPDAGEPVNVAREIVGAVVAKVRNNWSAFEGN